MIECVDNMIQQLDMVADKILNKTAGEWADYPRGITPREVVWKAGNVTLVKFGGNHDSDLTPMLIVPSLINRWYVLDVTENASFIKPLAAARPTYMIDWGYPGAESAHLPLSHYYHRCIKRAVRQIRKMTGAAKVDMMGYCIGGTLAYAFSCLEPELVDHLVLLTAPIDFSKAGVLKNYADSFPVEEFGQAMENMPGCMLASSLNMIQPMGSYQKTKMFYNKFEKEGFTELYTAMERWISDPVDFPGRAYVELLAELYQSNLLTRGMLYTAEGRRVDPSARKAKVLVLNAGKDHIAPVATTSLPDSDKGFVKQITISSGHIGITTGRNSQIACQNLIDFLSE